MTPTPSETGSLFRCQKAGRDLSISNPHCANPKSYCKWRTACPVHALEKGRFGLDTDVGPAELG